MYKLFLVNSSDTTLRFQYAFYICARSKLNKLFKAVFNNRVQTAENNFNGYFVLRNDIKTIYLFSYLWTKACINSNHKT